MFSLFSYSASEAMVMALQNFTINCTVEWKQLNCTVDDGYAPALDQGTFYTVNDEPSIECKVVAIAICRISSDVFLRASH